MTVRQPGTEANRVVSLQHITRRRSGGRTGVRRQLMRRPALYHTVFSITMIPSFTILVLFFHISKFVRVCLF